MLVFGQHTIVDRDSEIAPTESLVLLEGNPISDFLIPSNSTLL